ncbi:MAG: hypothetical protein K1X85_01580 [Ignavibacteria bacterium]|nr:hypothetical protein [Ignavibacteria bacterium]
MNDQFKDILDQIRQKECLNNEELSKVSGLLNDIESELQAKSLELQIEHALDCVRAVAMKMRKPEDMLDVCRMISDQLISLGIRNIRNVQTAVFNESEHTYINFVYFLLDDETSIYEVDYDAQPDVSAFAHKMLDGPDEFFTTSFDNAKIRDYLEYQKNAGQYVDEHLRNSESLNFYFYSLGTGALGISTYHPLNEDEVGLFKRFRNVFELAYRRFTDIQTALDQAREAQIEAALERVRAVAMSMSRSEDLLQVCETVFKELRSLGFEEGLLRNTQIVINNDEKEFYNGYQYSDYVGGEIAEVPYHLHPVIKMLNEKLRQSTDAFADIEISGSELDDWKRFVRSFPQKYDEKLFETPKLHYYFYSVGIGALGISTFRSLGTEQLEILQRFRNVFDLCYKRYNDIKQAEAQAREAMIEASLERVRSRAVAMHTSEELVEASDVFFRQLGLLGIDTVRTGIGLFDSRNETVEVWSRAYTGEHSEQKILGIVPKNVNSFFKECFDAWKNKEPYFTYSFKENEVREFYASMKNILSYPERTEFNDEEHFSIFYFPEGSLNVVSKQKLRDEELSVLTRFAGVFGLMYRRFLDLKKAEEQTREANIETSLERVRAAAMSMMKPEDLLNVCETLYTEFQRLGFEEIRNAMINIHNDGKSTFINYDYSDEIGRSITPLYYDIHPVISKQIKEIRKANDAFSETVFEGKDLEGWIDFRRSRGEKDDPRINALTSLHYYFYSIGNGSIGISTFSPISSDKLVLLKRFRNVFSLSYRRYSDIALAGEQAREAKIEAALERVRSRSTGMQKSEELRDVIKVVYEQFAQLKIFVEHSGFIIDYKTRDDMLIWLADEHQIPYQITIPYFDSPHWNSFIEAKQKGLDFFANHLTFEEKNKFYQDLFKHFPVSEEARAYYLNCPGLAISTVLLDNIGLYIENFSGIPYTDEENATLMRFGKVFQQTYTRFLDLQNAEEQAREARIESALERVRSRAMAMHSSEDLSSAISAFFQELKLLGVKPWRCGVGQIEEETRTTYLTTTSLSSEGDHTEVTGKLRQEGHPVLDKIFEHWKMQKDYFPVLRGKEIDEYYKVTKPQIAYPDYPVDSVQYGHMIFFKEGFVFAWTEKEMSEDELRIFRKFAGVLSLTYRRYLDLKEAEAQAREAKIEASLERVRAKAMAMHKTDDFNDAVKVVFDELGKLNLEMQRCGIAILDAEKRSADLWTVFISQKGSVMNIWGEESMDIHPLLKGAFKAWQDHEDFSYVLKGSDLISYYDVLKQTNFPLPESESGVADPGEDAQYYHNSTFEYGGLFAFRNSEFPDEAKKVMKRFAGVFTLTYKRFLDLQRAEASAREAQIEAGLERVRSRTLAMHSSDELAETAAVLFRQLISLGISPNRLYIAIIKDDSGNAEFWITDEDGSKVSSGFSANLNDNASFKKMFEGWKLHEKSITIDMQGKELEEYFQHLTSLNVPFIGGLSQTRRVQNISYFSQGFIGIASPDPQPDMTIQLIERFASVFNLTYARFSDLKLAEAQAQKAQIETALERVRARALAMQQPEELKEVEDVLRHEMGLLGLDELETCSIFVRDGSTNTFECRYALKKHHEEKLQLVTDQFTIDLKDTGAGRDMLKFYDSGDEHASIAMKGDNRVEWVRYCEERSAPFRGYYRDNIPDKTYHLHKFSHGAIGVVSDGDISAESRDLLRRAASVFSLAYSRFKDLMQARIDLENLKEEKKRADSLLLNILPEEIANELKQFGRSYARNHEEVTILYADIKGFTVIAETLSAQELVTQLDECFRAFDKIVDKHGLEKIRTIGDAYVCACGLPKPVPDNAVRTVRAALDMVTFIKGFGMTRQIQDLPAFEFRVGIHTGPVITGVVGLKKFTYDIWGDSVTMAARMEQHGEAGKINISGSTYQLVKDKFKCVHRGKIEAKNKGEVDMYFVEG